MDYSAIIIFILAILFTGIAKGGFGGGLAFLGVPILSLVVDPLRAVAIMLPILCFMDLLAVWKYRMQWDWKILRQVLPTAIFGIVIASLLFKYLNSSYIKLLIGLMALSFVLSHWLRSKTKQVVPHSSIFRGGFWGLISGFSSTIAHAGGPPFNIYMLPLRLHKNVLQGTAVAYFAIVNYIKLIPYFYLQLFEFEQLMFSLYLIPLAYIGVLWGVKLHHAVPQKIYYQVMYCATLIISVKLIYSGSIEVVYS